MKQKDKKILLITPFVNPYEESSGRVNKLQNILIDNDIDFDLITTNFNHAKKKEFDIFAKEESFIHLKVPKYKTNISIKRFYSHTVFAFKLLKFLIKYGKNYDLFYSTVPTSLSALVCILYSKINKKKTMDDVIDLWPESFSVLLPFSRFTKYFFAPWYLTSFIVYRYSDKLFAESKKYANYVQRFSKEKVEYVNLGIDIDLVEKSTLEGKSLINKKNDLIYVCYGGSLGCSYDFDVILDTLKLLKKNNYTNFHFVFIGDGDKKEYIEKQIKEFDLSATITGRLSYCDFIKTLSECDIGINSFLKDTEVVYSYKFNDYLSVGLAVLNNLKGETSDLIDKYNLGFNFDHKENKLFDSLKYLLENRELLKEMKQNSINFAKDLLDYKQEYKKYINFIKETNA